MFTEKLYGTVTNPSFVCRIPMNFSQAPLTLRWPGIDSVLEQDVLCGLAAEPGTRTVHNYGHGGSGVTYSWGCALDVADLVSQIMSGAGR